MRNGRPFGRVIDLSRSLSTLIGGTPFGQATAARQNSYAALLMCDHSEHFASAAIDEDTLLRPEKREATLMRVVILQRWSVPENVELSVDQLLANRMNPRNGARIVRALRQAAIGHVSLAFLRDLHTPRVKFAADPCF